MFGIEIKTAKKVLSEFQTQLKQMNRIIYETEETISKYTKNEQNTLMRNQLKAELELLIVQRRRLLECVSYFRQIIELYEETEEQILEYEGDLMQRPRLEADWVSVQYSEETNNFIKQIKI